MPANFSKLAAKRSAIFEYIRNEFRQIWGVILRHIGEGLPAMKEAGLMDCCNGACEVAEEAT